MREPIGAVGRLTSVRRLTVLVLLALMTLAVPSAAQTTQGFSLDVATGIDGWVPPRGPFMVRVTVDADVLVAGTLLVTYAGSFTEVPVDVPAGGSKVYEVPVRSVMTNSSVSVELLDADRERLARQSVRPEVATDEVVAATDDDSLATSLEAVQTAIGSRPVVAVTLPVEPVADDLAAVGYVVTTSPDDRVWDWVAGGGRLVTTIDAAGAAPIALDELGDHPGGSLDWFRAGSGEVVTVDGSLADVDWASTLRPTPLVPVAQQGWGSVESSLVSTATNSGDGGLSDLPWLPFALAAYLIVVGPLNLFILKRTQRRDWAWLTIPAIATLAVTGFWVAGRQRLDSTALRHATVVVGDGDDAYRRTVLIVAAGEERSYELSVGGDATYAVTEVASVFGDVTAGNTPGRLTGDGVAWDLPQLGVGSALVSGPTDPGISASIRSDGEGFHVDVSNLGDDEFEYWGSVIGGLVTVGPGALAPGQSGSLSPTANDAPGGGMGVGDTIVERLQLWDRRGWEVVSPLAYAGAQELPPGRGYVFGIDTSTEIEAGVNGTPESVGGPTIWMAPLDPPATGGIDVSGAQIVSFGDFRSIDIGQGSGWIDTDTLTMRFTSSGAADTITFRSIRDWGRPENVIEVWNWDTGAFEEQTIDFPIPAGAIVSASGETIVRIKARQGQGEPLFTNSVWAEYDA